MDAPAQSRSATCAVKRLAHVNIRASDLARTIRFYADILGLHAAPVPGNPDMAHQVWLHDAAGDAVIHAGDLDLRAITRGDDVGPDVAQTGSGAIDHIAFEAWDVAAMTRHLDALGVPYRRNAVPAAGLQQIFITDPDGILIELNFFD